MKENVNVYICLYLKYILFISGLWIKSIDLEYQYNNNNNYDY